MIDFEEYEKTKKIKDDSVGKLIKINVSHSLTKRIVFGDEDKYDKDETKFLEISNDLFNSFKHSLMHDGSHTIFGSDFPTIVSYYAKYNDNQRIIQFHNHNAYHIMMGFQDTVKRILDNQRIYLTAIT